MFRYNKCVSALLVFGLALILRGGALADEGDVVGVVGFSPVESLSCIGVWLPLAEDEALAGVRWYNNDGTVAFSKLYLSAGDADGPGSLNDATVVREMVQGGSSAWSQSVFDEDYCTDTGGLYLFFQLPFGSVQVAEGEGGGLVLAI